ncbi:prepilin-type N-terminal cleavage/methylation domain-containing protein [Pseudomonas abietaniphila]|uniref:prepilin-type N-terminal cleavage/methylation domain-containing protein n=1 Tax=Pseudomonas abietaniphila TaxID=89065 RepID=UPI0007814FD4|nr:prepilin-type N-terminal cleavage/methylation domain-containing protein [Pseudomonas abietaniphila]
MNGFPTIEGLPRQQRGLSLIELMVAMLIGLILILGVTQIFINNQTTYLFQQGQVGNQENGRFSLALLNQELSKAGYRSDPTKAFPPGSGQGCAFAAGTSVIAVSATTLCIRYQAANKADVNCQGKALASGDQDTILNPYRQINPIIYEKISFDVTTNSIFCTVGATSQPLVTGVAALSFEFGEGSMDLKTVTSFSTNPTETIGVVRYTLLMQSPGTVSIRDTATQSPALAEWKSRFGAAPSDTKQIYQLVQGTTMIRNQLQ